MNYMGSENKPVTEFQLNEFHRLIDMLFQCCRERLAYQSQKFDLPDAELRCLICLNHDKYMTSKSLASKMNVGKSRMTRIIRGLLEKKFIKRIKDPEDSRIGLISLTSEGRKKVEEIKAFQDQLHNIILSQVSDAERKRLLTSLDLLKACMEAGKEVMK